MQTPANKIKCFELIVEELVVWYTERKKISSNDNDLGTLKTLKLLFFVVASKAKPDSKSILLEDIFNNFVAMPYGHVESDVYNYMKSKKGNFQNFIINNEKATPRIKEEGYFNDLHFDVKNEIKDSISYLKSNYPNLVLMSSFDLVDLSHAWYSWKFYYSKALKVGSKSSPIPYNVIKEEDKVFSLQMI